MDKILQLMRPFVAKMVARGILWGLVTLLGMNATQVEGATAKAASGISALILLIIASLLDRYHHKKDLAEKP